MNYSKDYLSKLINEDINSFYKIEGGGNSHVFKVLVRKQVYVIKIFPLSQLEGTILFFKIIRKSGLNKIKIYKSGKIDESFGFILMDYLDTDSSKLSKSKLIKEIARQLSILNSNSSKGFGENAEFKTMLSFIQSRLSTWTELFNYSQEIFRIVTVMNKLAEEIFEDVPRKSFITHGDASLHNALVSEDQVYLIDPGKVRFALPEWELAYFERRYLGSNDRDREKIGKEFGEAYRKHFSGVIDENKVDFFRIQVALGKLAWSLDTNNDLKGPGKQLKNCINISRYKSILTIS